MQMKIFKSTQVKILMIRNSYTMNGFFNFIEGRFGRLLLWFLIITLLFLTYKINAQIV